VDGAASCGAVADRARSAAGMLRAALAALAEEAESHAVRQVRVKLIARPWVVTASAVLRNGAVCCQRCCISRQHEHVASAGSGCFAAQVTPLSLGPVLCHIAHDCGAQPEALRPLHVQGDGGQAFRDLDDSDNAVTAAHALTEVCTSARHTIAVPVSSVSGTCGGQVHGGINKNRVRKVWP
jgi:hypothetical protein